MTIGIVGAGNLGSAFARGLGERVLVSDPDLARAQSLADAVGGTVVSSNDELAERADVVVLCHKPAQLASVASGISAVSGGILSFVGATTVDALRRAYPGTPVCRAMPNTALAVGASVTVVAEPESDADRAFHETAAAILARVGSVIVLPESQMLLAQASSGAMPAYVAYVAEAQIDGLIARGLDASTATALVLGSISGAAQVIAEANGDTLGVRRSVTSPGGTTAKALSALEQHGVRAAFAAAIDAAIGESP